MFVDRYKEEDLLQAHPDFDFTEMRRKSTLIKLVY